MLLRKLIFAMLVIFTIILNGGGAVAVEEIYVGGTLPKDCVVTPDDQYLYLGLDNDPDGIVTVLRLSDNAIVDSISVGGSPLEITVTPNGQFVYVTNTINGYYTTKIDVSSNTKLADIHGGTDPAGIAITPDGSTACIVCHWSSSLQLLDVATDTEVGSIPGISHGGLNIAITPDGQFAYVTARTGGPNPGSGLLKVSLITEEVDTTIAVNGDGLAITPDGEEVWVAGHHYSNEDKVYIVSTTCDSVIDSVTVGEKVRDVAISPDGKYAYVVSQFSETLTKISISDRKRVRTIPVGDSPTRVALSSDGSKGFVTNLGSNTVSIINLVIPKITKVSDIPNDQGKQVRIEWDNCMNDTIGSLTPITEYAIYRKIDYTLSAPSYDKSYELTKENNGEEIYLYPPGNWDCLMSIPACAEQEYSVVVPTLADSTISDGIYYSTFFIRALTSTPGVYYDSVPDSGYSVDNLDPGAPGGFTVAYNSGSGNELSWEECEDEDFNYYNIYRSEESGFDPSEENLIHSTADILWFDTVEEGWKYHYKIASIDFSGNESDPKSPDEVTGIEEPHMPASFALHQNYPNPFNPVTTIHFDLPVGSKVNLSIYDVNGKRVMVLLDKEMTAGRKSVSWNGMSSSGETVASGVYFYRISADEFVETRKMILMR